VSVGGTIAGVLILGAGLLALAVVFWRYGREYREAVQELYVRDPDELGAPPAVCGYVARLDRLRSRDLSATLVDLIARGVLGLHLEEGKPASTAMVRLCPERAQKLWPHAVALLHLLFYSDSGSRQAQCRLLWRRCWREKEAFDRLVGYFGTCVIDETGTLGLGLEPYGPAALGLMFGMSSVFVVLSVVASIVAGYWLFVVIGVVVAVVVLVFANAMYRRRHAGRVLQLRCAALRRFWRDFGRLGEKDLESVVLWERHLSFAIALGDARLVRSRLSDRWGLLGRVTEALQLDDQRRFYPGRPVTDDVIDGWRRELGLPAESVDEQADPADSGTVPEAGDVTATGASPGVGGVATRGGPPPEGG
jgi:hypothetical protein